MSNWNATRKQRKAMKDLDRALDEQHALSRRALLGGAVILAGTVAGSFNRISDALAAGSGDTVATRMSAGSLEADDPQVVALRQAVGTLRDRDRNGAALDGWMRMAGYHRDFCATSDASVQIHTSWNFLPWHRLYLTVVERHLQAAIGDPSLGLTYWDWYADGSIPAAYRGEDNPLGDSTRSPVGERMQSDHYGGFASERSLTGVPTFVRFGGLPASGGFAEGGPHVGGHNFVGGNMARFDTAGMDPLFYSHHGNIDRLWEVWRNSDGAAGPRPEPQAGSVWDNRSHSFMDADGSVLTCVASETVSTTDLGYRYDETQPKMLMADGGGDFIPLSQGVRTEIPLGANVGSSLGKGGIALKPDVGNDALTAPLSDLPAADLMEDRRAFLSIESFQIPPDSGYLHVHIDFDGDPGTLTQETSRDAPTYAGGRSYTAYSADPEENPAVSIELEITDLLRERTLSIVKTDILLIAFDLSGNQIEGAISIGRITLQLQ